MTDIEEHSRRRSAIADTFRRELVVLTINKDRPLYRTSAKSKSKQYLSRKEKSSVSHYVHPGLGRRFRVVDDECPVSHQRQQVMRR